jgi:hypothetical protein
MESLDELRLRTEDLRKEDILRLFVPTPADDEIVRLLKAPTPVILEGSRGTGKSFLLRVAEIELEESFDETHILPVYISFIRSSLVQTSDPLQFQHWMLSKICNRILRAIKSHGFVDLYDAKVLAGSSDGNSEPTRLDRLEAEYEESYKRPGMVISAEGLPTVERLKDAVEDFCQAHKISRLCFFFDEATHIFRPEQQRQFFTLFRDLRSPYITCNAAVYPGVTSYGDVFELTHDANLKRLEREVSSPWYLEGMRDLAIRQVDSSTATAILRNDLTFSVLAYCVGGNPRLLLKNLAECPQIGPQQVSDLIKKFYRANIWSEHSGLAESYPGHRNLIDWGRNFIEAEVLPRLHERNMRALREADTESSCYFWIQRDAPESVKHALRLLAYVGIVQKGEDLIRATRSELGTRYTVNFGCVLSQEANPTAVGIELVRKLSLKRFVEFGANHASFEAIRNIVIDSESSLATLRKQLQRSVMELDLTSWQKSQLVDSGVTSVGEVLEKDESFFVTHLYYVGPKRARRIKNAADAAVLEYLSG